MHSQQDQGNSAATSATRGARPTQLTLLAVLIALEAVFMLGVAGFLLYELLTQPALSFASSAGLVVMAALAAVLLVALAIGACRSQSWVRGPITVWQVLQVAAAVVIFQGDIARPVGWVLAGVSLVCLLLVFSAPVGSALRRDREV